MARERMSAARKALMWWFEWPGNPHVSITVGFDFTPGRAYLAALNGGNDGPAVTVHHLAAAVIARLLTEFPQANARIVGNHIERVKHVGMAMPVNLLEQAGARLETSMTLVESVDTMTLGELSTACRHAVAKERSGGSINPVMQVLKKVADFAPYELVSGVLGTLDRALQHTPAARFFYDKLPFTTALTNGGAAFHSESGVLLRAISMVIPQRLVHVPTVWGLSTVQDEVLAVDGAPAVRPVLPVVLVFDHRLFDGVMAGRMLLRFSEVLRDPAAVFGATGDRRIAG